MIFFKNLRYKSLLDFERNTQYRLRVYMWSYNRFHVTLFQTISKLYKVQHSRNLIQLQIGENGKVYKNVITHIISVPDDILWVAIYYIS